MVDKIFIAIIVASTALVAALVIAWRSSKIRTLKEFSTWAGGVQSVALTVAVSLGGIWALAVFLALQQAKVAEEDLKDKVSKQTALETTFQVADLGGEPGQSSDVLITISLHNAGTRALLLDLAHTTICIRPSQALCSSSTTYKLYDLDGGNEASGAFLIAPGVTKLLPLHWRAPTAGIYLCKFDSPVPDELQGKEKSHLTSYRGWCFFKVGIVRTATPT
jgi:hypothetical protein